MTKKLVCLNGWTDITWLECMICSHSETCEPFMLRRLRNAIESAKAYGFDVPDDVVTLDQFNEMFEIDFHDGGTHGVTRKSDGLYQGAEWHKQNFILDSDGYYKRRTKDDGLKFSIEMPPEELDEEMISFIKMLGTTPIAK